MVTGSTKKFQFIDTDCSRCLPTSNYETKDSLFKLNRSQAYFQGLIKIFVCRKV